MAKANTAADDEFNTFADDNEGDSLMVNLSEVQAQSFEPIPKGKYPVVIEECEFQISKSSGKPMWAMRFGVTEGEYANRKLFMYMSFSEKALPSTKGNLVHIGPEFLEGNFDPRKVANEGTLIGRTCIAVVAMEKGQDDQERNVIKGLRASGTAGSDDGFGG